jgi:predicted ATPase
VQSGLADVFIDVIQKRQIQIILESHSEHLLRRLQRRIAEGSLPSEKTAIYFSNLQDGVSHLEALEIDTFGQIRNWPSGFFGDVAGDMVATLDASIERQISKSVR